MNRFIAYCGLDCEACEAHKATVTDDNALREKVAQEWSELNGVEITPEMISCRDAGWTASRRSIAIRCARSASAR